MRKYTQSGVAFLVLLFTLAGCTGKTKQQTQEFTGEITHVNHPEWSRNAVIYEVNIRQYTDEGTIKAFQEHLPRLKELGVDILWFMPVHPISEVNRKGTLGSYYAIRDYHAVNPEFGTIDDFKNLVQQAHSLGFKVLLDWVANHSGCDNVWLESHPEWYVRDENGNPMSPYDWTDTYKLDYDNPDMRKGMTDALKFWVAECDIDGYRCDVAYEVPTDFWNNARKELEAIKPVFMLAEADAPELTADAFDMTYNWPLKNLVNQIAKGKNAVKSTYAPIDAPEEMSEKKAIDLDELLASYNERYPTDSYVMNFITNHDENSWDGSEFTRLGDGVKAFAVLTYTIPGMPLIYTGQETGLTRELEFFDKDTPPDWSVNEWFYFYRQLNRLKHSQEALRAGTAGGEMVRYLTDSQDIYIFSRSKGNSEVLVMLNLSAEPVEFEYTANAPEGDYTDFFTGTSSPLPLNLEQWGYRVYIK